MEAALSVCLARPRPGAVHDLRSATRRIEAQLYLLDLIPGTPRHRAEKLKLLKQLAKLRRAAGKVRDLDIQQRLLASAFPHNVEAAALRDHLRQKREQAAADLVELLARHQTRAAAAMEQLLRALQAAERRSLAATQLLHLTEQWFEQRKERHARKSETIKSLHTIRKAAKLARYLAESAPGAPAQAAAARFERIQKAGGHWHDWLQLSKLRQVGKDTALAAHMKRRAATYLHSYRATLM
jgi:CHAD domain-containing protein